MNFKCSVTFSFTRLICKYISTPQVEINVTTHIWQFLKYKMVSFSLTQGKKMSFWTENQIF